MDSEEELRKKKLQEQEKNYQSPFQITKFLRNIDLQTIIQQFFHFSREELAEKKVQVRVAGRILRLRLIFALLNDQEAIIQLMFSQNKKFKEINIGDIVGIEGVVCKSQKGELSIKVNDFVLLNRCLKPLPDLHYGFANIEERFRKRYLDLIINRQNRKILIQRFQIINSIREFLNQRGFVEVETPILVSAASGAQAKPFTTHHNKLQRDFYLRTATEIPLKMLLVGGLEKVYEIGRIFRNEGIDARHNPEFTTVEIYQSYENAECMMNLTEELFHYLTQEVLQKEEFEFNSQVINLQKPFRRMSMTEAIKEHVNIDFTKVNSLEKALELAQKHNLKLENFQKSIGQIILIFFEEYVEKKLIQPTFIYDYPIEVSPLAKSKTDNKDIADRFELYIGGLEFANGYSELNDPIEQKKRFEEQTKQKELGNEEIASFDKEFLEALEYGMPPAGGLGIGIDRLIMLFTGQNSIKEVIAFPQLKKKNQEIEEVDLKPEIFSKEAEMRDFFAENDNLNKIFPSLHFLVKEYQVRKNSFFDTIAFNPNNKSFVIIEYKLENESDKLNQILKYIKSLNDSQKILVSSQYEGEELKRLASLVKIGCVKIKEDKHLYVETDDKELLKLNTRRKKKGAVEKPNQMLKIDTKKRIRELSDYLKKSHSSLREKAMNKLAEKDKKELESEFKFQNNKGAYKEEFDSEYIIDDEKNFKKSFDLLKVPQELRKYLEPGQKYVKQLFSYLWQEKSTKISSYYTFDLISEKDLFYNVNLGKGELSDSLNVDSLIDSGKKFRDLKDISEKDSKILFNQFLTILRINAISDKSNAFDKIINLFIAKVFDELGEDKQFEIRTKEEDIINFEGLKFQFLDIDTDESFMKRLYDLYKEGMREYLQKEIIDYSDYEILTLLNSKKSRKILEMVDDLRLKKDNTFAFIEVFDNKTFKDNCLIVKEIVNLLASFKFRYADKSKSLGEFFEDLLNTSLKQEAEISNSYTSNVKSKLNLYKTTKFSWAKDYVFGIGKDYRLAKTTKISLFLNGDGEAKILHADGINKFSCENYQKTILSSNENKNEKFDFVVSNPPYSVQDDTFELLEEINEKDARIEIIFVERTYQLLKKNRFAAIILPQTFLSQEKYAKTRKWLLERFEILSLFCSADSTFGYTTTSPCILFLKKKIQISKHLSEDLNYNIFLVNSPKMFLASKNTKETLKKEREFLGYEFSQSRNKSGIKILNNNLVKKYSNHVNNFFLNKKAHYSDSNSRTVLISANYIENLEYVEIGNLQNNQITGSFKKGKTSYRIAKKGDILISSLTPSKQKVVLVEKDYKVSKAIHVLSFQNPTHRKYIYEYLLENRNNIFEVFNSLLDGFKITYSKITKITYMDTEKLAKLKELRSQMEGVSIKFCQEALEKNNYDLQLAHQWLEEKAKLFRKDLGGEEQKQKFGIVGIKEKGKKIVAFLLTYKDPSIPSDNKQFQEVVAKIEDILLDNFSDLYGKSSWALPSTARELLDKLSLITKDKEINLEKCRFFQQKDQEKLGIYLHHNKKIGALVLIQGGNEEIAHELALQIVANKPRFLSLDSIPRDIWEKERQKFLAQAQEENPEKKPEIIQKIVQGKLDKQLTNACFFRTKQFP
ncbi:13690_t:CDS:2 [Entrophospora sp. SA101]|nr:13690_t:CDS:2 [Entrophospora sp. SA101]